MSGSGWELQSFYTCTIQGTENYTIEGALLVQSVNCTSFGIASRAL